MNRKPSIFAQKMGKMREIRNNANQSQNNFTSNISTTSPFGDRSYIVTGEESQDIHLENISKLSALSKEEIDEKRNELLQVLNPAHIEFLKKKRSENTNIGLELSLDKLTTKELPVNVNLGLKNRGVHMDVVEPEKLKWMEDVPSITKPLPDSLYSARFNFDGDLLPYIEENKSTCDKGLYHHGEEPQRPGYTIEELYQLSRSSVVRQRIVALNTLAAILEKEYLLSECLETPLLKPLLDSGIFLILRFSLDERLRTVYLAALKAISALLWRPLDMHYLSDMVGVFGDLKLPSFEVVSEVLLTGEQTEEIKDLELLQLDVIKGALRTDIHQRFRYILEDPLLETDHLLSMIKCLTRICYHSYEATSVVLQTPTLLEVLFAHAQFPLNSEKLYIAKLTILFRVIACRSADFALVLATRLNVVPFLLGVVGDSVTKTSAATQCIYLWHALLFHGVGVESVRELSPMFVTLLGQLHRVQMGNMKIELITYGTALITLVTFLADRFYDSVAFLVPTLEQLCCQWMHAIENEPDVPGEFVKLFANTAHLLTAVGGDDLSTFRAKTSRFVESNAYANYTARLKSCSFVLNASKRNYVDSLPSLCVPMSILGTRNSVSLTHAVVGHALARGDRAFARDIFDARIWDYVDAVLEHAALPGIANLWGARYEIAFLCDVVKLCAKWRMFVDRRLIRLAFALVRVVHADDKHRVRDLFADVLFDASVYESVLIDDADSMANDAFADLENTKRFFANELNLAVGNDGTPPAPALMSTRNGTDYALSTDWHYVPILKISNAKRGSATDVRVESIRPILKWIYLIEYLSDYIQIDMSVACRYCRVSCAFFCGDVFLDLADILGGILGEMLKRNDRLEFKTEIAGVSSFYDFYRGLCEQFASSSYCNPIFAAYVLVPLQQKHDRRYRKYVWTEQSVILRFINLSVDQLMTPIRCYLEPCETDVELIETYLHAIATGRLKENISPVMYRIGLHHVATFIDQYKNEAVAQKLRQIVEKLGNEDIRRKILNYEKY